MNKTKCWDVCHSSILDNQHFLCLLSSFIDTVKKVNGFDGWWFNMSKIWLSCMKSLPLANFFIIFIRHHLLLLFLYKHSTQGATVFTRRSMIQTLYRSSQALILDNRQL